MHINIQNIFSVLNTVSIIIMLKYSINAIFNKWVSTVIQYILVLNIFCIDISLMQPTRVLSFFFSLPLILGYAFIQLPFKRVVNL